MMPDCPESIPGRPAIPMSELPKTYDASTVESRRYAEWLARGDFRANPDSAKPSYSIVIPPPNVTGVLTLGHVLNNTIQDILARRARMLGMEVLWLPGTDHAGIATQTVVERTLKKKGEIRHRDDLGREKFLGKVWEWKEKHGGIIIEQLKRLGASCDWSRERFTMDPDYSRCVQQVFVDLFQKGFIYRGKRMVNWCPVSLTALSDEEVVMKPQNGVLYHFKVRVEGEPGTWLTIATTRPETIPGDSAIAVHPADPRYKHLIGRHAIRPLPVQIPDAEKRIPIIADEHIDIAFGTGVLKVTPAHDKADFEIGRRHGLAEIDIMNADGTMNALAGESLVGLDRFEARAAAVEHLRELGVLVQEEPYQNNVGFSERADVPVEPRLSEQWFLKYPSADKARAAVADGDLKFFPDRWAKVYDHWMENLQDWCISRQLWWGHRIPVWYRGEEMVCQIECPQGEGWTQDCDVLDTWFSSWLWPFATMGWPEKTGTLARFYPTTDLVTGPDIIFFWVARMIMAGYEFMGEPPFRNVYFTGIIRDKQGRKMSKSLGNSPDPLDLIGKFGADALRFGVMRSAPLGQDVIYDEKNVELGRNFCTKLWNAARFRQMQPGPVEGEIDAAKLTPDDRWILLRLDEAIRDVSGALNEFRFSDATQALYRFFWSEFCDWYLEAAKAGLVSEELRDNTLAVLDFVLAHVLRLFHPFLPFITEELWDGLGYRADLPADQGGETIQFAHWPAPFDKEFKDHYGLSPQADQQAGERHETVLAGRALRRDYNIASNRRVRFILQPVENPSAHDVAVIALLLGADPLELDAKYYPPRGTPSAPTPLGQLYMPLEGLVDPSAERDRLSKEIAKAEAELDKVRKKLASRSFTDNAPPEVVGEHRGRERDFAAKIVQFRKMFDALG